MFTLRLLGKSKLLSGFTTFSIILRLRFLIIVNLKVSYRLIHQSTKMRQLGIVIIFFLAFKTIYSSKPIDYENNLVYFGSQITENLAEKEDNLSQIKSFKEAFIRYSLISKSNGLKKITNFIKRINFSKKYFLNRASTSILMNNEPMALKNSPELKATLEKYPPKFGLLSFAYLYVSLIGFYIAIMINLNKKTEQIAKILISGFVLIHSVFIFHICFNLTNYHFLFPDSYRMSTVFSFLYGPLLYFYFKRITQHYEFKIRDVIHFIPTVLLIIYLIPIYTLPTDAKLNILLERENGTAGAVQTFETSTLVVLKVLSLVIYGYFIRSLYLKSKTLKPENRIWQRNIYYIHFLYIIAYASYGILISNTISSGFLYHSQVACMAAMVMYIGYSANVQPAVFNGSLTFNKLFYKYEKSGLTKSLSLELKENLLHLFHNEKIYKDNCLNLDTLSEKLNTNRHNTSQVINEHFKMSFHELINTHRIREAKAILNSDMQKNLNIIDIAYEVGYNNKVTFNKAFKKDTQLTPSQYQRISINA